MTKNKAIEMLTMFKKQDKFTWWMPKNMVRMTLYGTPQTKLQWMFGTWKAYLAYWRLHIAMLQCIIDLSKKQQHEGQQP